MSVEGGGGLQVLSGSAQHFLDAKQRMVTEDYKAWSRQVVNVRDMKSHNPLGCVYTTSKPTSTGKIVMVIHETVPYISGNQ